MKLPINLTPAKALEILRGYFPKADGYKLRLGCSVRDYDWQPEAITEFEIRAWRDGGAHTTEGGPTLGSALSLIIEGREPVKLFTEDAGAVHFFKSAEDDAEALRLPALSAGAKVEDWPRYYSNGLELWRADSLTRVRYHNREWQDSSFSSLTALLGGTDIKQITREEATRLTGGAL